MPKQHRQDCSTNRHTSLPRSQQCTNICAHLAVSAEPLLSGSHSADSSCSAASHRASFLQPAEDILRLCCIQPDAPLGILVRMFAIGGSIQLLHAVSFCKTPCTTSSQSACCVMQGTAYPHFMSAYAVNRRHWEKAPVHLCLPHILTQIAHIKAFCTSVSEFKGPARQKHKQCAMVCCTILMFYLSSQDQPVMPVWNSDLQLWHFCQAFCYIST